MVGRSLITFSFGRALALSTPAYGAVDPANGLFAAADKQGSVAVAYLQGDAANRRIVVSGQRRRG